MASFDPHTQNVTFFLADGETSVQVPIPQIDGNVVYTASVCINYGTQMGAALAMLLVTLIMTPFAKLRRPSGILQLLVLSLCVIRMALLSAYFPSGFNEFYNILSGDFSTVPRSDFHTSVIANTFSLLLVFAVELALMHQAWAMVALWPDVARYTLSALSLLITLLTVGWRLAATTIQSKAVLSLTSTQDTLWVAQWAVITNAISICWFCALFNAKLVAHLITNHGVLPSRKSLSPMEVLVMTNGVLMIIPGMWPISRAYSFLLSKVNTH
jgi:pheromone alpha factor receptor